MTGTPHALTDNCVTMLHRHDADLVASTGTSST